VALLAVPLQVTLIPVLRLFKGPRISGQFSRSGWPAPPTPLPFSVLDAQRDGRAAARGPRVGPIDGAGWQHVPEARRADDPARRSARSRSSSSCSSGTTAGHARDHRPGQPGEPAADRRRREPVELARPELAVPDGRGVPHGDPAARDLLPVSSDCSSGHHRGAIKG
jgi:hypothetical protein